MASWNSSGMISVSQILLVMSFVKTGLTDGFLDLIHCWWEVKLINCWILWYLVQNSWVNRGRSTEVIDKVFSQPVSDAAFCPLARLCYQMRGGVVLGFGGPYTALIALKSCLHLGKSA